MLSVISHLARRHRQQANVMQNGPKYIVATVPRAIIDTAVCDSNKTNGRSSRQYSHSGFDLLGDGGVSMSLLWSYC